MSDRSAAPHTPVLLAEVLDALAPRDGEVYLDGTFGAGGYTRAILDAASCRVIALDRDPTAFATATRMAGDFPARLLPVHARFGALDAASASALSSPAPNLDGVVLDIGVSSMQLDEPERGFSFMHDGPLDMRMSPSGPHAGLSAADVVNTFEADALADILFQFGEERRSRQIARAIVMDRTATPFTRTKQLADLACRVLKSPKIDGRHAATRTFQALRIFVNDELGELTRALDAAERALMPGGRLVVVTFHSLEDRLVKAFFRARTGSEQGASRHAPPARSTGPAPTFTQPVRKAIAASGAETAANPRARSAHLRWAVRAPAPAWPAANGFNGRI